MAKYRVTGPDGGTYEITAPDDVSQEEVFAVAQKNMTQPRVEKRPEDVGNVAAALEGAAQGLSFGFADELEGGARALYNKVTGDSRSFGDLYDEGVAKPRKRAADAAETNPVAYYGGEIGSGFVVPGGLARVGIKGALAHASGRGLGARAVAGAKEGAAYGAAYGAGKAEGGPEATLTGTIEGAGAGAMFGAALPPLIDVGANVVRRVAAPFRAAMNPQQFAGEKVGEAIARDLSRADGATGDIGAQRFANRFDSMSGSNSAVRAMDAGGENVRGLMRSAANMPNQARESTRRALDSRQANQWSRIEESADAALAPGKQFNQTIDDIVTARDAAAGPAFAKAFQTETPLTPRLTDVLNRPTIQKVGERVQLRLQDEGKTLGPENNTEWLHRVKLELDDLIGQSKRAEQMGNTPQAGFDTRTLVTLKHDLLNAVDNPGYKAALKQYAGPSSLKFAAETGEKEFMKASPFEIRKAIANMSPDEQEMYRLGAKQALFSRMEAPNVNRDLTDGIFGSAGMQKRLEALFPDRKAYREFQKQLVIEAKMADSRKAIQGNSTTAKQLTEGDQAGKTSRLVMSAVNAASGRIEPILNMLAQGYNRFSGITPGVANEILRMGMSRDPGKINALAQQGLQAADRTAASRAGFASALQSGYSAIGAPDPSDPSSAFPRRNALMP